MIYKSGKRWFIKWNGMNLGPFRFRWLAELCCVDLENHG